MRDDTKHATEGTSVKQLVLPTSEATDDTHLTVKEEHTETNTKPLVFSREYRQATLNKGNVELIELTKSTILCPSCAHDVFEGTFVCNCGEVLKLDQDAINRIKEAIDNLKVLFRTSPIPTRSAEYGPSPWQWYHHKGRDADRGLTKGFRRFTSIWERWQNDEVHKQSQFVHNWSDAWVRYLDHIVQFSIFHDASQQQREKYEPTCFTQR